MLLIPQWKPYVHGCSQQEQYGIVRSDYFLVDNMAYMGSQQYIASVDIFVVDSNNKQVRKCLVPRRPSTNQLTHLNLGPIATFHVHNSIVRNDDSDFCRGETLIT